jgi:hypothetical protein
MTYSLDCDSCEFQREIADEEATYSVAKDHETEFPDHFVFIERTD